MTSVDPLVLVLQTTHRIRASVEVVYIGSRVVVGVVPIAILTVVVHVLAIPVAESWEDVGAVSAEASLKTAAQNKVPKTGSKQLSLHCYCSFHDNMIDGHIPGSIPR